MKIFISWSGIKSKKFAEELKDWIPMVIQSAKPYFSPDDIEKGARWSIDIATELNSSQTGIICLTRDNLHSDWILFEAGALSKTIDKTHVCPILFGISNIDVSGPLKQFQTTSFNKQDFMKLISLINSKLNEHKLAPKILERSFEMCWPEFEEKINTILKESESGAKGDLPIRSDRDLLEEILNISRKEFNRNLSRSSLIPDAVFNDLVEHFLELSSQQKDSEGDYQDALNILKEMRKPIHFLLRRSAKKNQNIDSLIKKLEDFSFVVIDDKNTSPEEDDGDDDDEIPF